MEVEVLVVPGCPNEAAAAGLVRGLLDELGQPDTPLTVCVIGSQAEADRQEFIGSPTLRINGTDPFAEPGRVPALACRLYSTRAGLRVPRCRRRAGRATHRRPHRREHTMTETPDPIEAGLRAWAAGDLDALEAVLAPDVTLLAVEPGPWNCDGRTQVMALLRSRRAEGPAYPVHVRRVDEHTWTVTTDAPVDPDGPEPFLHGTRITVTGGRVTAMQQYRADTATI